MSRLMFVRSYFWHQTSQKPPLYLSVVTVIGHICLVVLIMLGSNRFNLCSSWQGLFGLLWRRMLQYDRRTPIYGYEIPSSVPRGVSDAVSLMLSLIRTSEICIILAHLVYQFIEVFVHRHCTGHYPILGGSGIEILLRICCLIGYYHNTAFILWSKIRKRFESYRTLNHYFSIFVFYAACLLCCVL